MFAWIVRMIYFIYDQIKSLHNRKVRKVFLIYVASRDNQFRDYPKCSYMCEA